MRTRNETLFLEVSVRYPAGSGEFVRLTPRQRITAAPQALVAKNALTASLATTATTATTASTALSMPWSGLTGQAGVSSPSVGNTWQFRMTNLEAGAFRGGLRLSDDGFVEMTNLADAVLPLFARLSSTGSWTAVSDARLKSDVTPAMDGLATAMRLRPVKYRWNSTGTVDLGMIAQEVRDVLPTAVSGDEAKEMLTVNYGQLSVVAIGAVQDLKRENDALRSELEQIRAEVKSLREAKDRAHEHR